MSTKEQLSAADFFESRQVFTLDQAVRAMSHAGEVAKIKERLRHHIEQGRLKPLERGLYAVVPRTVRPDSFQPDAFLAAAAVRSDGVFSHHAALELLGVAHSVWHDVTMYCARRRRPLQLGRSQVRYLAHPSRLTQAGKERIGTRTIERMGQVLRVTGPERTLVEGFRDLALVGGAEELVTSAAGFPVLDTALLVKILGCYRTHALWSSVGWFLDAHRDHFAVTEACLSAMSEHRPRSSQYLLRDQRGGTLNARWNLILPDALLKLREPDDR